MPIQLAKAMNRNPIGVSFEYAHLGRVATDSFPGQRFAKDPGTGRCLSPRSIGQQTMGDLSHRKFENSDGALRRRVYIPPCELSEQQLSPGRPSLQP
jgi:hypothetical protein